MNPVNHTQTRAGVHKYKTEPYVIAADVYSAGQHTGRGGWTWYTGAAGWMYRAALEYLLGFKKRGSHLFIEPCIPRSWREFEIKYRYGTTVYHIVVENPHGACRGIGQVEVDGEALASESIPLVDDGRKHRVRVQLGEQGVDQQLLGGEIAQAEV